MVISTLKSSELKECNEQISQLVKSIRERRLNLRVNSKISQGDFLNIGNLETELIGKQNQIAIRQIDEILTDLQQPVEKIKKVTGKLDAAIKKLEEVNQFVQILTNLTNLVSAILKPASGGLVKIAGIVDQLNNFT